MKSAYRACIFLVAMAVGLPFTSTDVWGDVFVLKTGGEVRGDLQNPDQAPRQHYVVAPYAGGKITLAAALVSDVVEQKPVEIAYDKLRAKYDDSVDAHWQLAKWCFENNLASERRKHLERILDFDTDHADARRHLGYQRVDDQWLTRDDIMVARGYVKHNNRWRLPQEVELMQKKKALKDVQHKWFTNLRLWRSWLEGSKAARGQEYILSVKSPYAVSALQKNLDECKKYEHKEIFAQAMANVGTAQAYSELVNYSIKDPDEDFRYFCLELLEKVKPPAATATFIKALQSKDNKEINRAAIGLRFMSDKNAVQPLIDVLVTEHKFKVGKGQAGQTTLGFGGAVGGRGGTSFGTGGGPKVVKAAIRNEEVLSALTELTGQDFHYDVDAWRYWYSSQKPKGPAINTRRDNE